MPFLFSAATARIIAGTGAALVLAGPIAMGEAAQDRYAAERTAMVEEIVRLARETRTETGRETLSARVLSAVARVPRHRLVSPADEAEAYRNRPLAIGLGQTISQPFIVALMTDLMDVRSGDKVLEIGTGSGYQAAVLAELGARVFTIEILEPLGRQAAARLQELGYGKIVTRIGDGYLGWAEEAPFDSIIVTAAPQEVPPALAEQLKVGGRLVIPLGSPSGTQTLYLMDKQPDGTLTRRSVLAVRFVPLTGSRAR